MTKKIYEVLHPAYWRRPLSQEFGNSHGFFETLSDAISAINRPIEKGDFLSTHSREAGDKILIVERELGVLAEYDKGKVVREWIYKDPSENDWLPSPTRPPPNYQWVQTVIEQDKLPLFPNA